jgi:hypothetical protein
MLRAISKGLGHTKRFAGDWLQRGLESAPGVKVGVGDVAGRLSMDAIFGLMTAANTPGSALDKTIAGTATTLGGGLGGAVLAGSLAGPLKGLRHNPHVRMVTELAGGVGGDMVGMAAGDAILRAKSPDGMSERDRQFKQADDAYRAQLEKEILQKYGIGGY